MSTPPNPLSKFRTYSYHHVLVVCDSTQTALEVSESGILADYFLNRAPEDRLKVQNTTQKGSYVVLISGFTDAQFVIQDLKWTTVIASNTPSSDMGPITSTVETDGEMTILEPYGVRFMNVLANVCSTLKTDPVGLVYMLKTFFVGQTDDGAQDVIANIRPFMFVPVDIQAKFDETGAIYNVGFVGISNGVGKMPYVNDIATFLTVTAPRGETLDRVFTEHLPKTIATEYNNIRAGLIKDFGNAGVTLADTDFRSVEYVFDIDPQYKNYKFGTNELIQTSNEPGSPILSFSSSPTMEHIIHSIMMSSKDVVEECNNEKDKFIFKITSSLESTPSTYRITFHIHRYQVLTVPIEDDKITVEPGNFIEFDYIFSGRNIDIQEFDIRMAYGLAFFQTISTNPNLIGQIQNASTQQYDANGFGGPIAGSQSRDSTLSATVRSKTPLFLGGQQANALLRNKANPISTANFQALLARHASIENVECKITIAGNPQLLDEMAATPRDFKNRQTETPKAEQTIAPRWMTVPAYVRINVFMPSTEPGEDFVDKFWYDGFYQMYTVTNVFSAGSFTQELEMFSLPFGSVLDKRSDETAKPASTTGAETRLPTTSSQEDIPPSVSSQDQTALSRTLLRTRQNAKG